MGPRHWAGLRSGSEVNYIMFGNRYNLNDFLCKYAVDRSTSVYGTRFLNCEKADKRRELNARNIYNTDITEEDVEGC